MATRTFKVVVHEGGEEPVVEVTVPLKLAKWAVSLLPALNGVINHQPGPAQSAGEASEADGGGGRRPWPKTGAVGEIDLQALRELLDEGFTELEEMEPMDLVKVNDGDTRVRVSIE